MIRALAHLPDHSFTNDVDLSNVQQVLRDRHTVLWVDVQAPTDAELEQLRVQFGLHELAVEDAARPHQRPKLEEYDHFYLLTFYALQIGARGIALTEDAALVEKEVDVFVGIDYVITVHAEPIREIEEGRKRWEGNHEVLGHGAGALLYALLDSMVDNYFEVADEVAERVAAVEERILQQGDRGTVQAVFALKKSILALRRVLGPERDALNVLMRQDLPLLDRKTLIYLRDVYDHVVRIMDAVDLQNDVLTSGLDAHLSNVSNQLSQVMKTLTSATVILMSMALIAGIYGMNFANMPELSWPLGYAWALGLMAASGLGLFLFLRKKDWL